MKDQIHREICMESIPAKIVCLVPSLTELLVDLGLEERIVGVTKFCVHPAHIRKTTSVVGGTKTIKNDKIEKLNPDFVLANKEENDANQVEELAEHFPVYVSDIKTIDDLLELINDLKVIFDLKVRADELTRSIAAGFEVLKHEMHKQPRLKVVYFIWRNPWMVVGSSTFINYMLELNNFENVYANSERYPEVRLEDLESLDYVFLSSEPFPFAAKHKKELPVEAAKIKIVDGEYFSWYGSRLVDAFKYFKTLRDKL